ncbi:hypothetical protein JXA56_02005 [Candidatus Micrarchaeota archaeon]|nr:hypothetical protein [Candidatus Micrarchaeota archaeon]
MADLGNVKIRKKIYKFDVKRKYEYVSHYKMIDRPPVERIKDAIKVFLKPKAGKKEAEPEKPQGGFNFAVIGAALLIAMIILGVGLLYITVSLGHTAPEVFQEPMDKPLIDNVLHDSELLSSGRLGFPEYTGAVFVEYGARNIDNYSIVLTPYREKIPSEIFLLNSQRVEATTYTNFTVHLRANLETRNILLNEITVTELESLPQGAIIIVPSGAVPKELLGYGSLLNMTALAEKGVVLIYMGQPFDRVLNGTLVNSLSQAQIASLPVTFDRNTPLQPSSDINLFQPLYRATGSGGWESKLIYGAISSVKRGNGAFIFVPQTLDGGWKRDAKSAADDISKLIFETPWAEPIAESKTYVIANQTAYSGKSYFYTEPFSFERTAPKATIKVEFIGESEASNVPVRQTLYTFVEKFDENQLFIQGGVKVVPTSITAESVRLNAVLKEQNPASLDMFLKITDENGTEVELFPQGPVNTQSERSFDISVDLDRGEYMVRLMDSSNVVHAQTYMKVVSIDITYKGPAAANPSTYVFAVTMDGSPVTLNEVSVNVNRGEYGSYQFRNVDTIRVDVGSKTDNQRLPYGNYNFEFTSGALRVNVPVSLPRPEGPFDNPVFWITIILTGGIVGLGVLFARREEISYWLDIPVFPPVARTRVPLSSDTILSIFQKVNENYRWENTPLTTAEIKNGFKDIFYKGRPIFITDFNVELLLDQLIKAGKVKFSINYYGLVSWEDKTKKTIDYLAMMRRIRDICVNNAVPFTSLNESKEADSVITVVGQQMYLHFYDRNADNKLSLKRALSTISKGITIMLFKNEAEKQNFIELVNSSPSVAPLILKLESESKSLLFHKPDELEQMVIDFKSM